MMRVAHLLVAMLAIMAAPAAAQSPFDDVVAMDDSQLAEERGGFSLPGGIELDMTIRQETSVDGELLLRSSYVLSDDGPVVSFEQVSEGFTVTAVEEEAGGRIVIEMPGTQVSHLMGRATGSIIENTADNRTISTITTVDLDLSRMEVGSIGSLIPTLGSLAVETASFGF